MWTNVRLKILHFLKRNKKIVLIIFIVWIIVFIINNLLKIYQEPIQLQTTYEPHKSVMDTKSSVPEKTSNEIEDLIDQYVTYCNDAEWDNAFNMLSSTCQEYSFDNSLEKYMEYAYTKMPTPKKYAIQDYSNDGNTYIYQIKYTDDLLATGLTNETYQFTEEKMIFKKQKDGSIEMSIGNFIDYIDINNISENDYLKVDVKSVVKYYSTEVYTIKFTNRTENTIVIADNQESDEVILVLASNDIRQRSDIQGEIVLEPKESQTLKLSFPIFYDNKDKSSKLVFSAVRVMEQYSGVEGVSDETIQSEIQNAVAKFSVNIPVSN